MGKTLGTLAVFVIVGLLPKVPWWAKIAIQVAIGAGIYILMPDGEFPLPYPDQNPIGAQLYGGNVAKAWGMPDAPTFAYLSVGVLFTVLGLLATGVYSLGALILGLTKKKETTP